MWHLSRVTVPPATESIPLDDVKLHCRVEASDDDAKLAALTTAAREHVEAYCGARFAVQTLEMQCDRWCDLSRLNEAPIQSVTSISYVDVAGVPQVLDPGVYELRADGLEPSIVLMDGEMWPSTRPGSRIFVTAVAGYASLPAVIAQAMLLFVDEAFHRRSSGATDRWTTMDMLLVNHRRGA